MGDTHRMRVHQSKIGRRTWYLERRTLRTQSSNMSDEAAGVERAENSECHEKVIFITKPNASTMGDTHRMRVYQSKTGHRTRYLERRTLRTQSLNMSDEDLLE